MEKLKKILTGVAVVAIAGYFVFTMFGKSIDHIEDTNGADNYYLQQITDENIINLDIGAKNISETKSVLSSLPEYSSKKFTGVSELYRTNMIGNRFDITIYNLWVESGNLRVVLLHNDEIVHEFTLNELSQTYTLKNPKGTVSLRVAGESADFTMSYDLIG